MFTVCLSTVQQETFASFAVCGNSRKFSLRNLRVWCPLARHKQSIRKSFLRANYIFNHMTFNRLLTKPLEHSTQVVIQTLHNANHNEHYTQIASLGQSFPCHWPFENDKLHFMLNISNQILTTLPFGCLALLPNFIWKCRNCWGSLSKEYHTMEP